jgi:hypothetical protein
MNQHKREKSMANVQTARWRWGVLAALLVGGQAHATLIQIDINTSFLAPGTSVDLAFDFFDGGSPDNSVTISNFTITGGSPNGSPTTTGNVTGDFSSPPVTLNDSTPVANSFFNEYLQNATLGGSGSSLTFRFSITGNAADPASSPDEFSFFFLDPTNFVNGIEQSLIATSDPTGADALFAFDIGAANQPAVYLPTTCPRGVVCVTATLVAGAVPEPGALGLAAAALLALGLARRGRNYPSPRKLSL